MNVLIFYASYGGGHLSAANSIKQHIEDNYKNVNVQLVDCMKYIDVHIDKLTTDAYKLMAKKMPWVWGKFYYTSEKGVMYSISNFNNKVMSLKLYKAFKEYKPDIVISTHPFSSQMVADLKKRGKTSCLLASVMTDFASHTQWLVGHEYMDLIFVSNEKMRHSIIEQGVDENKIFATGIPLSNRFLANFDRVGIKKSFNLDLSKKTILFFGGGEFGLGSETTVNILKSFMNNIKDKYQMIVISGKNEQIKEKFEQVVAEQNLNDKVFVYGYTAQVPEFMAISDLVVTKPGGLTTSESLASGLPIVVINPIPGQEEENAEFLVEHGIAVWLKKKDNFEEKISQLLSDEIELEHMKIKSKLMAKKNSTADICAKVFELYKDQKYID